MKTASDPRIESVAPPANGRRPNRYRRALAYALPFKGAVGAILASTLVVAALNALEPLILKRIFDSFSAQDPQRALLGGIALLLGAGLVREVAGGVANWLTWKTRIGLQFNLLEATVERLHRLPLSVYRSEGVGAIITKLDRSIQGFIGAVSQLLFTSLPSVLYLGLSVAVMVQLEWRLALVVLGFALLPPGISAVAAPEQVRRERALMERWARIYGRFNEVLSGIMTVRSFAMEDAEKKRFLRDVSEANRVVVRGVGVDTGFGAANSLVVMLARIAALIIGGLLVLRQELSVGTLVAFLGYVGGLFGPVQGLSGIYQTLRTASVSLDEIFAILDRREHLADAADAGDLPEIRGEVVFDQVSFNYEQEGQPLLKNISLKVRAGETIALVGPSGAGKSTMMALLQRFYDPVSGAILLDGYDLRKIRQRSLRRQIGVVLQDPLLFNDTILSNIAYGRPDATEAQIEAAAKAANAHEFIMRMPEGYRTQVGERGSRLSIGERQRITIARALVKNPRLIVLDEATSSLDAESEALVQEALERLMTGRTGFVIAHRLSTVVNAHRILVLNDGEILEQGTHGQLMRLGGYYAGLVRRQTCGLIRNVGE